MSLLRRRWHLGNAPQLDWRQTACLVVLGLALAGLGFGDWLPVQALLLLSAVERATSLIGTRLQRDNWFARPFLGWGHVAESTLALAALGSVLSESGIGSFWGLRSFWNDFWQVAAMATFGAYLVVLIWQVFRRVRGVVFAATVFTIGVSILIAVVLSVLLAGAIRILGV